MTGKHFSVAAIRFNDGDDVDGILERAVIELSRTGCRLDGYLQREISAGRDCCTTTALVSIHDNSVSQISQALGGQARGCRLDPQALAGLVGPLNTRLDKQTDLLIINRFGKGESLGGGFRSVIGHACGQDIPVLTAVRDTYLDAWMEFTGGQFSALPPDLDAVLDWMHATHSAKPGAGRFVLHEDHAGLAV